MTNTSGEEFSLEASDIATLAFSDNSDNSGSGDDNGENDSVESINADTTSDFTVFGTDGVNYGRFDSVNDAFKALSPGIYLFKQSDGKTFKTVIK